MSTKYQSYTFMGELKQDMCRTAQTYVNKMNSIQGALGEVGHVGLSAMAADRGASMGKSASTTIGKAMLGCSTWAICRDHVVFRYYSVNGTSHRGGSLRWERVAGFAGLT